MDKTWPVRHLVAIAGPIGAGKSTVAELLAGRVRESGMAASLTDLDDVALAQRTGVDLTEFWARAGVAHSALVRGWFEAGVDVVIAHGPFHEARCYDSLFGAAPPDAARHHVLLRAPFEVALQRVRADPARGPAAPSVQPGFLRATHEAFLRSAGTMPAASTDIDTSRLSAVEVADRVFLLIASR